jgi:hypothetical protein
MERTISEIRWEQTPEDQRKIDSSGQKWLLFRTGEGNNWEKVKIARLEHAPVIGKITEESPWEGIYARKPWAYRITAAIPLLNASDLASICVETLRLQTVPPFIMLIDTGSSDEELARLEALRDTDLEVHSIRLNGVRHPSDFPAMAMDVAFALCRSEYCFATHIDCFLRRRDFLEDLLDLSQMKNTPVLGYELSPRAHEDWKGMVSHTASLYHMPTMDKIGFGWNLRRLCSRYGIEDYSPDPTRPSWPDTEILGNYILRENGIEPLLIGHEGNQCRTKDENIDHFRSLVSAKMYSPGYYQTVAKWCEEAKEEAVERIEKWKGLA